MAVCTWCKQDMAEGAGCTLVEYEIDGKFIERILYGSEEESFGAYLPGSEICIPATSPGNCHDCNCPPGSLHHPGCDGERCPKCKGQARSCGCSSESDVGFQPEWVTARAIEPPPPPEATPTGSTSDLLVTLIDRTKRIMPLLEEDNAHRANLYLSIALSNLRLALDAVDGN